MTKPRLCVAVTADSTTTLRERRDAASRVADLVELRLDGVRDIDIAGALAGRRVPVIVTCRPRREGGAFDGPEEQRLAFLAEAVRQGADYVDVEWSSAFGSILALRGGRGVVLSHHDFDGVPPDLAGKWRGMRATGAEVVKLAVMARTLCDTLPLLELAAEGRLASLPGAPALQSGSGEPGGAVLLAMGLPGLASRVLAARFGSRWTYAGQAVAPGQMPAEQMIDEFRFHHVTAATRVFGVVGNPIGHSLSPAIHNAAFDETGEDAVFLPLEAASAQDFRRFAEAVGLAGAAVTAPFKQALAEGAGRDEDDPARSLGVINTLMRSGAGWQARNSDVAGFLAPLDERGLSLQGRRAAIVGAGGSARSVAMALAGRGARVTVHGRDHHRALQAAAAAPGAAASDALPVSGGWDLLVNATPVGTWPRVEETPVPAEALVGGGLVYDLVYNPARTRLLADAAAAGCEVIGGLEMLVAQATRQFEWWTGRAAPLEVMRRAAVRRLTADLPADLAGDR
jgi:3-dehydroquinate dehydratase / shikimate dehydrogenase